MSMLRASVIVVGGLSIAVLARLVGGSLLASLVAVGLIGAGLVGAALHVDEDLRRPLWQAAIGSTLIFAGVFCAWVGGTEPTAWVLAGLLSLSGLAVAGHALHVQRRSAEGGPGREE